MKNILIAIVAMVVMTFASCSVGAGIQIRASENGVPKDSLKSSSTSNSAPKDSVQSPVTPEPVK